jgi:energy-coupling factor transporter ATP-binding protein EcfA2
MSEFFKPIPTNITNEHLKQAISKIDEEGIPKNSDSNYYDVLFNERKYPPKVIVSFANLFANGEIIDRRSFPGGSDTPCFKLLERNGFNIIPKELKLPFQITLYDIHGDSAIENYQSLKSPDNTLFLWDDSKFKKLNTGDYVFWVNRAKQEALLTKIATKNLVPTFKNGENTIYFNGFVGIAKAENSDKYKNFIGFEILEKVEIDDIWNYTETSTFSSQLMALNLLVVGTKLQELPKKIEKLEDLDRIFSESEITSEIIQKAIEILEEKAGGFLQKVLTQEEFILYISQFDKDELYQYFKWLKYFLEQLNINFGDERITYNYYNRSLIVTFGQRYGMIYKPFGKEAKYLIMSASSIGNLDKDKTFGGEPLCYFCRRNELDLSESDSIEVLKGMKLELARTERSGYRKYNKDNFERYILEEFEDNKKKNSFIPSFISASENQNLYFDSFLSKRYIASLATKPFVIFTGLSGSGKTKLAQTFAKWISTSEAQYKVIPVGADWTNREPLLGYPNSLDSRNYVLPDNGALDLILNAIENAKDKKAEECAPYFLILDEMNLSHVERYFADFLSGMESKEPISLYTGNVRFDENNRQIPQQIILPPNLFIVGTVNIDETTYMFSPKVLDRANTIEFRLDQTDLEKYFDAEISESKEVIDSMGSEFTNVFMQLVNKGTEVKSDKHDFLLGFFDALQSIGAEFGYRTANEMNRLIFKLEVLGLNGTENSLDVAVMQKLLPKLHGSRTKLNKVLPVLASFCLKDQKLEIAKTFLDEVQREGRLSKEKMNQLTLVLSFAKIARMYRATQENGFASFAEG